MALMAGGWIYLTRIDGPRRRGAPPEAIRASRIAGVRDLEVNGRHATVVTLTDGGTLLAAEALDAVLAQLDPPNGDATPARRAPNTPQ